jgi:hypothetical protein
MSKRWQDGDLGNMAQAYNRISNDPFAESRHPATASFLSVNPRAVAPSLLFSEPR